MSSRLHRGHEEGAAALEFALIAPLLIVLFFGIVQIGIAVYRTQVIEAAAREGARVASVGGDESEVTAAVEAAATGFDSDTELTIDTTNLCEALPDDTVVEVAASGDRLNFTIPFVGSYTPTFTASATFRCEQGS